MSVGQKNDVNGCFSWSLVLRALTPLNSKVFRVASVEFGQKQKRYKYRPFTDEGDVSSQSPVWMLPALKHSLQRITWWRLLPTLENKALSHYADCWREVRSVDDAKQGQKKLRRIFFPKIACVRRDFKLLLVADVLDVVQMDLCFKVSSLGNNLRLATIDLLIVESLVLIASDQNGA